MERLSIPTVRSPLQRLEEAIQTLNLKSHLTPEQRWLEYENLFKSWFSWNPTNNNAAAANIAPLPSSQPPPPAANILTPNEQTMIETLPKSYRERGRQLLIFIKGTEDMKSGNLTLDNILGVDGSTLLHYALRKKKNKKLQPPPAAWDRFISFLRKNNIDEKQKHLLALEHRKSSKPLLRRKQRRTPEEEEEEEAPSVRTVKPAAAAVGGLLQKGKGRFFVPLANYQDYWWTSL